MSSPHLIEFDHLPQSIEEYVSLRDRIAHTPYGGAAMMVVAMLVYAVGEELGRQCLTVAVDRGRLEEGPDGYRGWRLRERDRRLIRAQINDAYIPRSYIRSTTPENGYRLPAPPFMVEFTENPYSGDPDSGACKVFVVSSGAASPRPVRMRRNYRGFWKAEEWSSLVVGVQAPARDVEDDL